MAMFGFVLLLVAMLTSNLQALGNFWGGATADVSAGIQQVIAVLGEALSTLGG